MVTQTSASSWPVVGHDWAVELLRGGVQAGHPPHALLITGPPNVGKGTLAQALAQALLCTAASPPCGCCRACELVAKHAHPDLRWVEPEGRSLKIAQVRELTRELALAPVESDWRVAVLDRFELATAGAANALLKTLEEPAPSVVLALLAQEAQALLPTVVSRCQVLALRPIPRGQIERALIERWVVEAQQAQSLSHICNGRLGWAVSAATRPELLERRAQALDDLVKALRSERTPRFGQAEWLAKQEREMVQERLELWSSWWRDLLILSSGADTPLTNVDRAAELQRLAGQISVETARRVLVAIRDSLTQLAQNANLRLALEVLLLDLPRLY